MGRTIRFDADGILLARHLLGQIILHAPDGYSYRALQILNGMVDETKDDLQEKK